jgi:hypothetical protein
MSLNQDTWCHIGECTAVLKEALIAAERLWPFRLSNAATSPAWQVDTTALYGYQETRRNLQLSFDVSIVWFIASRSNLVCCSSRFPSTQGKAAGEVCVPKLTTWPVVPVEVKFRRHCHACAFSN